MTSVPLYDQPHIYRRRWTLLAAMCLSLVMVVMAVSSLNVAIPAIQTDLQATATEVQWIIDAYALVFAGLLLTAGALGDRYGRKGALMGGLVIFGLGAVLGGVADSPNVVIAARALQGVGAAFVMPATLSLITAVFPPAERTRAIAVWAGFAGAGGAIGPIVTGALLESFWWGSAFLVIVPVIVINMVAVGVLSPRSRDDARTPLDPPGAVLSLLGLGALLYGIIEGPEEGWTSGIVIGAFVVAVVMLAGFVARQFTARHPMLPLDLFTDRRFSVGSAVITIAFFVMFGFFFLFSQYLQFARGYSTLEAGLATLPFALTLVIVAPRSAALGQRFGPGRLMAAGFALIAAGAVALTLIGTETSYFMLLIPLILLGAGMSITTAPATGSIMSAVPLGKAGVGSAVNDTTREVGGALGIAVLGSIVNSAYRSGIDLSGLELSESAAAAAEESVGGATGVAATMPDSATLLERASSAFTDAFNTVATVQAVIAVATAALVLAVFGRRRDSETVKAVDAVDLESSALTAEATA